MLEIALHQLLRPGRYATKADPAELAEYNADKDNSSADTPVTETVTLAINQPEPSPARLFVRPEIVALPMPVS